MSTITIARELVTDWAGDTPLDGFTLTRNDDDTAWTVSDGRDAAEVEDDAEALRTYAEFIDTFADDQEPSTRAVWQAEIDRARADAESLRVGARADASWELREAARASRSASERVRTLAIAAVAAGVSEVRASELAGVSRPTLRKWLGK